MPRAYGKEKKRGERFGRLGSCAQSVQADKIQKSNSQNSGNFPEYGEKAFGKEGGTRVSQNHLSF